LHSLWKLRSKERQKGARCSSSVKGAGERLEKLLSSLQRPISALRKKIGSSRTIDKSKEKGLGGRRLLTTAFRGERDRSLVSRGMKGKPSIKIPEVAG